MARGRVEEGVSLAELGLATRNHGMPLEALRDEITPVGLHYLLIHYDVPAVDPDAWRLRFEGALGKELELSLEQLRERPARTVAATMECAGNGRALLEPRPVSQPWLLEAVGTAEWTGAPLSEIIAEAEPQAETVELLFTGLDRGVEGEVDQLYQRSLPLEECRRADVLLAYEMNGDPLSPQHGFPVRLVVPGWYGMTNVKWLRSITALAERFDGYQQARSYRLRQTEEEAGEPVTRMAPRALMIPPGVPDFATRERYLGREECELRGRAWSGWGPIEAVQVSVDGGEEWIDATVGTAPGPHAWHPWTVSWPPREPGRYLLRCRARDAAGNEQPLDQAWNLGGYANNVAQAVTVHVE